MKQKSFFDHWKELLRLIFKENAKKNIALCPGYVPNTRPVCHNSPLKASEFYGLVMERKGKVDAKDGPTVGFVDNCNIQITWSLFTLKSI